MKNKPYKVKVSVSPDEDIIQIIKALAEQDDRNFSSYINKVLKEHIQKFTFDKKFPTQEYSLSHSLWSYIVSSILLTSLTNGNTSLLLLAIYIMFIRTQQLVLWAVLNSYKIFIYFS